MKYLPEADRMSAFQGTRSSDMIRETTYTGARQNLASLMDQVTDTREPVYIRRRGKEDVALIAASELSGLMETEYLLRSPKNAERLRQAEEEILAGRGVVMTVEELRERFGLTEE